MVFWNSLEVDAYDKLEVSVSAGDGGTIQVIPVATNTVTFLCIQSSQYSPLITYQVNCGGDAIALDSLQNFMGQGGVSALNSAAESSTLVLSNGLVDDDVQIRILVGCSATA